MMSNSLRDKRADQLGIEFPRADWPRTPKFPAVEYEQRVAAVSRESISQGIDLLVVTDPRNIAYLTGYDAHSYYIPQAALVYAPSATVVLVLRDMDVSCVEWLSHLREDQVVGYPDKYVTGLAHPMEFVGDVIKSRGWSLGRIGVGEDSYGLSLTGMQALTKKLPHATFCDSGLLIEWVRTTKTALELDAIRGAGKISDYAMSVAQEVIAVGASELDVAAAVHHALVKGLPGIPSSDLLYPCIGNGPRAAAPHLSWFDDHYRSGAPAMYELGGIHKGYGAGLSRTVFLGKPTPEYRKFGEIAEEGLESAVERLVAGNSVHEVEAAWAQVTKPHGYDKRARIGYSIGLAQPGVGWIDGTVSVTAEDRTVLKPGMTIHMMVAIWEPPVGYALSETFIVHDGKAESVSALPRGLLVKDGR